MKIFVSGTVLFFVAFILHLIVWRIRLPKKQTKALAIIFFGTFLTWSLFLLGRWVFGLSWEFYFPSKISEYTHILLYFTAVTFVYIGGYTLLEADSPSLMLIDRIHSAGTEGLDKDSLYTCLNDGTLVVPRVNDLLRDEMATLENGVYKITPKGACMVRFLMFHRQLMKADRKGG